MVIYSFYGNVEFYTSILPYRMSSSSILLYFHTTRDSVRSWLKVAKKKKTVWRAEEPCISTKKALCVLKRALLSRKRALPFRKNTCIESAGVDRLYAGAQSAQMRGVIITKSPTFPQKSLIFPKKSPTFPHLRRTCGSGLSLHRCAERADVPCVLAPGSRTCPGTHAVFSHIHESCM